MSTLVRELVIDHNLTPELQLKSVIKQYNSLEGYARKLEKKIEELKKDNAEKKEENRRLFGTKTTLYRENKRLNAHIEWLESKLGKSEGEGAKD
ncbi:hypothetical protein SAMN04488494_0567 [Xylanibacter ruminicola]|uniref:Uncharacterized protein n=1 Tax=Xylanibacter ruminicola TaxID=839 RepID=A0A1M7CY67_XYLRU|nr:hypothetical protein [Xylanibacter ruminicola]SHL72206.1 hypothetical protein SAMN04488494_0567 [Xylanibacter ruminicola]